MAKKCLNFKSDTPLLHTACYDIAHFDGHIKDFQKIPVVLSKCGAIGVEPTFYIDDLKGL